MLKRGVKGWG